MRLRAIREFAMSRRILVHVAGANAWPCHPRALALGPAEAACCVRPSCRAPSLGPATEMVFCRPDLQGPNDSVRSEEHTSELQSLMRNSYAVFCLKKKKIKHK